MTITSAPDAAQPDHASHSGAGLYIALVPWVLFTLLAQHSTLKVAAVAALVVACAIMVRSMLTAGLKVLELGAVLAFIAFTVGAFAGDHATAVWMARYSRAIAAALLALIAFGSLVFTPFTEQYAREQVPRAFWPSAAFKATNRRLTLMWASVFAAMVPFHVIAGVIDKKPTNVICNWVIPISLIVWAAKRSEEVSAQASGAS